MGTGKAMIKLVLQIVAEALIAMGWLKPSAAAADDGAEWLRKRVALSPNDKRLLALIEESRALLYSEIEDEFKGTEVETRLPTRLADLQLAGFIVQDKARGVFRVSDEYLPHIPVVGAPTIFRGPGG